MIIQERKNKSNLEKVLLTLFYIFTIFWVIILLIPFTWMASSALKNQVSVFKMPPQWIPDIPFCIHVVLDYGDMNIEEEDMSKDIARLTWICQDNFQERTLIQRIDIKVIKGDYLTHSFDLPFFEAKFRRRCCINKMVLDTAIIDSNYVELLKGLEIDNERKEWKVTRHGEPDSLTQMAKDVIYNIPLSGNIRTLYLKHSVLSLFDSFRYGFKYAFSRGLERIFFGRFLFNSLWVVFWVIVLQLIISSLAGYALAYLFPNWLTKTLLIFFMATMMIPPLLLFMPLILLMREFPMAVIPFTNIHLPTINILDSYWALILPHTAWGLSIYLFMGFFKRIPGDLLDAARIDGCSEWKIFYRIVLPTSKPVFSVMTLWTFYAVWPTFLWPYILSAFQDMSKWTFPVALYFAEVQTPYPNVIMAISVLATIPTIIFFFIFQKFIQKGFVWSGVKG